METNFITAVFLPLALGIIMLGMGLSLRIEDFKRIFKYPKAVFLGLLLQIVLLPLFGFFLVTSFNLRPELAIGLLLVAFCPGGATSNLISHLSRADVALSISLTAFSSMITIFTVPIFTNWALLYFVDADKSIQMPVLNTILQIILVTALPVAIGMWLYKKYPEKCRRSMRAVNIVSGIFFVLVLVAAIAKERENIIPYFREVGMVAFLLNAGMMAFSMVVARIFFLSRKQMFSLSIETGIQNGTLAIAIAAGPLMLNNTQYAIAPAVYSLVMFITAGIVIFVGSKVNSPNIPTASQ
ncbi:MAG: bile acid:sodium symporter family protein [Cyclobacteriaceae bacterium]|nr:bile acid:sodium symporter family protein [Cyclobacteriaceae bacterium]MCH8515080.1 bile acid:sodium symporter family protein [Cyclobacteriaceae bacterium]